MRILFIFFIAFGSILAQDKNVDENRFSTYYLQKKTLFEFLPNDQGEIIFLGNSITDGCEWGELFGNSLIKNRGISGDITEGILYRLREVTESKPAKIFLMIGVNDLARGIAIDSVIASYRKIIDQIYRVTPETELLLQSVLPVNSEYPKFINHVNKSDSILVLNRGIAGLASEYGLTYIDLHKSFVQDDGQLDPKYSNDGLHLTGPGYLHWRQIIEPYLQTTGK